VDVLLRKYPEKARPQEELDELMAIYKPGDTVDAFPSLHIPLDLTDVASRLDCHLLRIFPRI